MCHLQALRERCIIWSENGCDAAIKGHELPHPSPPPHSTPPSNTCKHPLEVENTPGQPVTRNRFSFPFVHWPCYSISFNPAHHGTHDEGTKMWSFIDAVAGRLRLCFGKDPSHHARMFKFDFFVFKRNKLIFRSFNTSCAIYSSRSSPQFWPPVGRCTRQTTTMGASDATTTISLSRAHQSLGTWSCHLRHSVEPT